MNSSCKYYCELITRRGTERSCDIGMDLTFCSKRCVYASNGEGTYVVDKRGKIIGKRPEGNVMSIKRLKKR